MNIENAISVQTLGERVKDALSGAELSNVCVEGEITKYSVDSRQEHVYITLKDLTVQNKVPIINGIVYKWNRGRLAYTPKVGDAVYALGDISYYSPSGQVSMSVRDFMYRGDGTRSAEVEALKQRLKAEGVFDRQRKPIPKMPSKICVITSLSHDSKAIDDLCDGFKNRNPFVQIIAIPATVSGDGVPASIADAIAKANETDADFIVITRGGGKPEEISEFSREEILRAIIASRLPTVSAIGHHTDHPLSDDVADIRAAVPHDTASTTVNDVFAMFEDIKKTFDLIEKQTEGIIERKLKDVEITGARIESNSPIRRIQTNEQKLEAVKTNIGRSVESLINGKNSAVINVLSAIERKKPSQQIALYEQKISDIRKSLASSSDHLMRNKEQKLAGTAAVIENLNPLAILIRGYSVAYKDGHALKSASEVKQGDNVRVKLYDGEFNAEVK